MNPRFFLDKDKLRVKSLGKSKETADIIKIWFFPSNYSGPESAMM